MSVPLYGREPTKRTIQQLHSDCVEDYALSESRRLIWEGICNVMRESYQKGLQKGELWCDSEFTEHRIDPASAALLLLPEHQVTEELLNLWMRDHLTEHLVHVHVLPQCPIDHPQRLAWDVYYEEHRSEFTEQGNKGVPIVSLEQCRDYFKS